MLITQNTLKIALGVGITSLFYLFLNSESLQDDISDNHKKEYCKLPDNFLKSDKNKKNILVLCHGKSYPQINKLINISESNIYSVDSNPKVYPDIVADLSDDIFWDQIPDKSFDQVIGCFCKCCTHDLIINNGNYVFEQISRILKTNGIFYFKNPLMFTFSFDPTVIIRPNIIQDIESYDFIYYPDDVIYTGFIVSYHKFIKH
jgi:SAM-dependent methyltransferase